MLKRILFSLAIVFIAATYSQAQITTSGITGNVIDSATKEPLIGASITATHVPSGTKYQALTSKKGEFTIHDMRSGGPYLVVVSFVGFESVTFDDVVLKLAEPFLLEVSMNKKSGTLENVIISTTKRNPILNSTRTGAMTNIGQREISQLPSINRSVNDLTRLTPQANGTSIGGGNFRQNNFTIDGSDFNNSFGIGQNLPANGSPISIDAIDEISVNVTPYDVRQSGFIGSAINAVTRAGTNQFQGSVYHYFRDQNQQGNQVNKTVFTKPPFEFKQYGGRIGGPIIKNKLFFFINYESENQPKQIQTRFAATSSAPYGPANPNVARPTAQELTDISNYLKTTYNYDTGPFDNYNTEIIRKKFVARIDWNISKNHKFNMRYSQVEGTEPTTPSSSTTGTGNSYSSGAGRLDNNSLWFSNSQYLQGANFYSFAAELNSKFGKISNTLRGTYTYQNDSRESPSQQFPFVDILKDGSPFTSFGYELFSYGNLRKVKMYSFVDNVNWRSGSHNWTVGAQADWSETINGFQRFGLGYFRFNSWDDFKNGVRPTDYALTYSLEKGFAQAFPRFEFRQYSGYAQDEIAISKKFKLTLGLRFDLPTYPDIPEVKTHPLVAALTFANGLKLNTGNLPKKEIQWSPRLGFNYDVYGNRSLQVRGGTGIFTGKVPFVWIVSQVGDAGMLQVTQSWNNTTANPNNFTGGFNPDPAAYRPSTVPTAGSVIPSAITAFDENFRFPQTWKSSLAMDTKLPWNMVFTLEGIVNKDLKTTYFQNVNLVAPQPLAVAGYPDSRMIYPVNNQQKFINPLTTTGQASPAGTNAFNAVYVTNSNRGIYASLTAKIDKAFRNGFGASLAYIKTFSNNLFDGSGDQPLSAWQGTQIVNSPNDPVLSHSSYTVPDRIVASFTYRKEYFKHFATTISMLYSGSIDYRFSYVYGADFNRDGFNGNDLMYIPKDPSEITFSAFTYPNGVNYTAAEQSALFFKYIDQDKYLRAHKGQFAERNGAQAPWRNQVDVRILQDLFTNVGKNRNTIQLSLDIFNFGNMLNPNWGKVRSVNASSLLVPTNQNSLVPGGTVRPTFRLQTDRNNPVTDTFRDNVSVTSTYYMQMGIRYIFNN
jgi:outer membrane receptor protein involved in Fe transport